MRPSSSDPKYLLVFWTNGRALLGKDQHIRLLHYKRQKKECSKLNNRGNRKVLKWNCNSISSSLQYPCECCPFLKNFSYICRVKRLSRPTLHICESVFRKSLHENVEVFLAKGRTEQHSLSYRYLWTGTFCVPWYPISIRVWGIVSFILARVFPQPSCR